MGGLFAALAGPSGAKADVGYGDIELWRDLYGGLAVKAGVAVNIRTAMEVTTVKGCVSRIAEALMCPCKVYRKAADGSRGEALDHALYEILDSEPNELQSGLEYRETVGLHVALTFNHYSYIGRVGSRIDELIPIEPHRVVPKLKSDGTMTYRVTWQDGSATDLDQSEVWHVRGPSWNGAFGMDGIKLLREAIGLAIATEETHSRFHSNGAQPGGVLSTEKDLSDKAIRDRLKEQFQQSAGGVANKFRTIVLDNGLKWEPMMTKGVDSQHLQLRQFQVEEICRGFGVMPIMVGYSGDKAPTFASAEQLFLAHLVHTVRPWHRRIAESARRWLLTPEERRAGYYVGFVDADFMSPDMKSKAEYYKIALGGAGNPGWVTPNQVRAFDEMGPEAGGDHLFAPINAGPLGADGIPIAPKPPAGTKPQQ